MGKFCCLLLSFTLLSGLALGQQPGEKPVVSTEPVAGAFPLIEQGKAVLIRINNNDLAGVKIAAKNLQNDIKAVTSLLPQISGSISGERMIIIGTIGKGGLIDTLIAERKLNVSGIKGKWEAHITAVVADPLPGVKQALVIAGSDKRGTIYGIYDLSAQMGVSPWYWWADVPVPHRNAVFVKPGFYVDKGPAVKYRGIFINDEAPCFSGWTKEKFGGVNHQVYSKIFELILRLKGNYLWPAMWGNAFNDDDKADPVLADEYGVVMGTSHHEPMDRAQQEWKRYGTGEWNYETNGAVLRDFWKKGIENMGSKETIVTVGMRGDGDKPMTEGSNIALLEKIVHDQRKIIADVTGKDTAQTPQMWALYKEVQDYYDKGMRVPDDVTLLLCDDNWGNIRKLPKPGETARKGGYGIYYHFDYVGDPRNYKWLNTNPISKTWEQMHLAYEYNARQVWVVNVGDLKPMEYPISFFLDYAWDPGKWPAGSTDDYTEQWAAQQFGAAHAREIAQILTRYTKYNGRRKPELLNENTYSLVNYHEFEDIVRNYDRLYTEAAGLYKKMPVQYKDAYYQLVLHPVQACANLNELYYYTAKNRLYAKQGRNTANAMADSVAACFKRDSLISHYYNKILAGGKWDHMMDQTHIGYTYWQEPPVNRMPKVVRIQLPSEPKMGVSIDGSEKPCPETGEEAVLPAIAKGDNDGGCIDVFNCGKGKFDFTASSQAKYVTAYPESGTVSDQQRLQITINWAQAPKGISRIPVVIKGNGQTVTIMAVVNNAADKSPGFYENNGYIAIEAPHYSRAINSNGITWQVLTDYGRTLSGVMPSPVTAMSQKPGKNSPHLSYPVELTDTGMVKVEAYISPTIDFTNSHGLRYAISIDNETPQIVNINADRSQTEWAKNVSDNIKKIVSLHHISSTGYHVLNYWMVDPGVVLQRLVINAGGEKESYLGPPESYRVKTGK